MQFKVQINRFAGFNVTQISKLNRFVWKSTNVYFFVASTVDRTRKFLLSLGDMPIAGEEKKVITVVQKEVPYEALPSCVQKGDEEE